jgi:hypothetical protein
MDRLDQLKPGTKITALPASAKEYDGYFPSQGSLVTGNIYIVAKVVIHGWMTRIELEEFSGLQFNCCSFSWSTP